MNVSLQVDRVASSQTASKTDSSNKAATSPQTNSAGTASAKSSSGQASTVTISAKAREALRVVGATPTEIAKVNLTDGMAVKRAVQAARLAHSKGSAKPATETKEKAPSSSLVATSTTEKTVTSSETLEAEEETSESADAEKTDTTQLSTQNSE
jgi:hypothetical protein